MAHFIHQAAQSFLQFAVKSLFVFILVIGVVVIATLLFFRQAQKSLNIDTTFSVSGTSERLVTPDIAEITIGAYVEGKDISEIQKQATEKINKASDAVKNLDIPEEDVQTVNYNLTPVNKKDSSTIESYTVNVAIKVTVRNTDPKDEMVGKVIDAATTAGLNEVRSLYFKVDNEEDILDELKLEAIADAKERSTSLAKESGIKLGKVLNMNEGYTPYYYDDYATGFGESAASPEIAVGKDVARSLTVQPGQFELSSTITLIYEIK